MSIVAGMIDDESFGMIDYESFGMPADRLTAVLVSLSLLYMLKIQPSFLLEPGSYSNHNLQGQ